MKSIPYDTPTPIRATGHDAIQPYEWWRTPGGKPLQEGKWYVVVITRVPHERGSIWRKGGETERHQSRWDFISGPFETPDGAVEAAALAGAAR